MTRPMPLSQLLLGVGQQVGQALGNLGNIYMQRQAAQGQGIKQQVGAQVQQAESYLADPNFKWDEDQRSAMEKFVNKGYEWLAMDDTALPTAYQQYMEQTKGGAMLPETVVRMGNATRPLSAQTTFKPYDGGITGLLGDVGQGVAQQTQARAEKEKNLDLLRQLRLNGQQQEFTTQRDAFLHKNNMTMAELESELGMKATQVQLDVQNSATAADRIISTLTGIVSLDDPKNKQKADAIMQRARGMGLQPYDLGAIETTYDSLGSGTASLTWKDRALDSGMKQQQFKLGEQELVLGGQRIVLGEYAKDTEQYLADRRPVEAFFNDHTAMRGIIAEAVANGDEKYLYDVANTLKAGGSINPEMYAALQAADITQENIAGQLEQVAKTKEFQDTSHELQMAETNAAFTQLQTSLTMDQYDVANAKQVFMGNASKIYAPHELEEMAKDPNSMVGRLVATGQLNETDIKAMKKGARINGIIQEQELNAPVIEQNMTLLETLGAVPANEEVAENALRSALGQLVNSGLYQADQVEGVVSVYRNQWAAGRATQNAELAATLQNTSYQQVLMDVQKNDLMGSAAEGDVTSLSDKWDMYRESYNQQLDILRTRGDAIGCGGDGISMSEDDKKSCASISAEIGRLGQQQKEATVELVGTLGPDGEATFMGQQVARIQANVMKNPKFANATHLEIARAVDNGLQRQGLPGLNPAAFEDAAARDATENPAPEGGAQPAAAAPSRTPLQRVAAGVEGATGMSRNRANAQGAALFDQLFSRPQPTTAQQLSASGASASSGGSVAGGSTAQPQNTPAPASNIFAQRAAARPAPAAPSQGVTVSLRDNPAFRDLTQSVSRYGALTGRERDGRQGKTQDELLAQLSRQTGLPRAQLLELARLETTASPSNPVPVPLYRQRAAARGQ